MLNSIVRDRKLAWRVTGFQLAAGLLSALAWLPYGPRAALGAFGAGVVVALANVVSAWRYFGSEGEPAGLVALRLLSASALRWAVVVFGLYLLVARFELPAPAVLTGLVLALSGYLFALRWQL